MREPLDPVPMPTLFLWPTGSTNVASASIEANANRVKGRYRLEIVDGVHQPALRRRSGSRPCCSSTSEHAR